MFDRSLTLRPSQYREYGFASGKDREFPNMVHLDLINVCNMRCIHCPQNDIKAHVPDYQPNQLDLQLFKKIIDEIAAHGSTLRITCDGEPFLYRHIVDAIDYIKQAGVACAAITTNGSVMPEKVVEAILRPSETKLVVDFSLDALFQPTYEKIRLRGDYAETYANVFSLIKNKKRNPNLRIVVNIIDQESLAEGELEAFKTFWVPVADDVVVRTYLNVKNMVNSSEVKMSEDQHRWPCSLLWNRLAISSFGRPRFCVADWKEQAAFRDIDLRHTSIKELWQSERYEHVRRLHLANDFQKIGICRDCTDWFGLKWGYDYRIVLDRLFDEKDVESLQRTVTNAATP